MLLLSEFLKKTSKALMKGNFETFTNVDTPVIPSNAPSTRYIAKLVPVRACGELFQINYLENSHNQLTSPKSSTVLSIEKVFDLACNIQEFHQSYVSNIEKYDAANIVVYNMESPFVSHLFYGDETKIVSVCKGELEMVVILDTSKLSVEVLRQTKSSCNGLHRLVVPSIVFLTKYLIPHEIITVKAGTTVVVHPKNSFYMINSVTTEIVVTFHKKANILPSIYLCGICTKYPMCFLCQERNVPGHFKNHPCPMCRVEVKNENEYREHILTFHAKCSVCNTKHVGEKCKEDFQLCCSQSNIEDIGYLQFKDESISLRGEEELMPINSDANKLPSKMPRRENKLPVDKRRKSTLGKKSPLKPDDEIEEIIIAEKRKSMSAKKSPKQPRLEECSKPDEIDEIITADDDEDSKILTNQLHMVGDKTHEKLFQSYTQSNISTYISS